jgi:hypothetical protein
MPQLERSDQRVYESLVCFSRPQSLALHVIPQYQFFGIRIQIRIDGAYLVLARTVPPPLR